MTIDPVLLAAVEAVGIIMEQAADPWWIIASAAVALHGADAGRVSDVDVLLSIADARSILPTISIDLQAGTAHPAFRSAVFRRWSGSTLPVEFMAGFHYLHGTRWRAVRPTTRHAVKVGGGVVFIPERAELHAMLTAFGRPKDRERARSLQSAAHQIAD
jgi:hypothetical protein